MGQKTSAFQERPLIGKQMIQTPAEAMAEKFFDDAFFEKFPNIKEDVQQGLYENSSKKLINAIKILRELKENPALLILQAIVAERLMKENHKTECLKRYETENKFKTVIDFVQSNNIEKNDVLDVLNYVEYKEKISKQVYSQLLKKLCSSHLNETCST